MSNIILMFLFVVLTSQTLKASDSIRIEKVLRSDWGAYIHFPTSQKPLPVLITLGGAEGGLCFIEEEANAMAKEGFIVMRLGYFKYSKSTLKQMHLKHSCGLLERFKRKGFNVKPLTILKAS